MEKSTARGYLEKLLQVTIEERECAKKLDMEGLVLAMQAKDELLRVLGHVRVIDDNDKPLAARIRAENRRNAFLFKSTLGWIRQTMEFFGQKTVTSTYAAHGGAVASRTSGRLLSGKI